MMRLGAFGVCALMLACAAQGGETTTDSDEAGIVACQPLETEAVAVELDEVLAAGQSEAGVVYVIGKVDNEPRVFVADGSELVLEVESGSGQTTTEEGTLTSFTFYERDPILHVELWQGQDGTQRMGVLAGELPDGVKQFEIGTVGEELAPVDVAQVAQLEPRRILNEVVVVYAAELADGRHLLVLRPDQLASPEDYRVFFGPSERLQERALTSIERARDGGSTTVDFLVDGEPATAFFPVVLVNEMFERGEPTLTVAGTALDIALTPDGAAPANADYFCER
jgi:hypothetical protein